MIDVRIVGGAPGNPRASRRCWSSQYPGESMTLRRLGAVVALIAAIVTNGVAHATDWIEVGADTQAKYYVDVDSIKVDGENVSVLKRGVFTQTMTDTLDNKSATFRETLGTVQIDCARRINRVTRIDMIGANGEVVWSSGPMKQRHWEDVRPNTHAEKTVEIVCARVK
jgi:hypothetical protein